MFPKNKFRGQINFNSQCKTSLERTSKGDLEQFNERDPGKVIFNILHFMFRVELDARS